jgi:hypothetical protein
MAFHEKAGRSQGIFSFFVGQGFSPAEVATVATLPSALLDERFLFARCKLGSRFSRCCHLLVDLWSISRSKLGQAIDAVTGTRRLGFVFPPRKI